MTELLVVREKIRKIYSEHGRLIGACTKALFVILAMLTIDSAIGHFRGIVYILILAGCGLVCAFLPVASAAWLLCLYAGADLAFLSPEICALFLGMGLLFLLLFFVFKPGNSYIMALSMMFTILQFYGPLPAAIGLLLNPVAIFPMVFGIIGGRVIMYAGENASSFAGLDSIGRIMQVLKGVFMNEQLYALIVVLAFCALIIYILRVLPIRHSWTAAVISGSSLYLLLTLLGDYLLNRSPDFVILIINAILLAITGTVLLFLFHMVDYAREERVQFEDDEYYYYVRAIPKLTVSVPEIKVTRIRESAVKEYTKPVGRIITDDVDTDVNMNDTITEPIMVAEHEEAPDEEEF